MQHPIRIPPEGGPVTLSPDLEEREHEWSRSRWSWRAGWFVERQLPEPVRIPWGGGPCSLRSFWCGVYTPAEQTLHGISRREFAKQGGVPNIRESDEVPTPMPWLAVRHIVGAGWRKAFGEGGANDEHRDVFAYVAWQISEEFTPERIRAEHGKVIKFAERLVERTISDTKPAPKKKGPARGKHRKKSGLLSLVNNPRLARPYADDPFWYEEGFLLDKNGNPGGPGGERRDEGVCPVNIARAVSLSEDALIAAIDLRHAKAPRKDAKLARKERDLREDKKIDITPQILQRFFGG